MMTLDTVLLLVGVVSLIALLFVFLWHRFRQGSVYDTVLSGSAIWQYAGKGGVPYTPDGGGVMVDTVQVSNKPGAHVVRLRNGRRITNVFLEDLRIAKTWATAVGRVRVFCRVDASGERHEWDLPDSLVERVSLSEEERERIVSKSLHDSDLLSAWKREASARTREFVDYGGETE